MVIHILRKEERVLYILVFFLFLYFSFFGGVAITKYSRLYNL